MLRHDVTAVPLDERGRLGIAYTEGKRAGFEEGRAFRTFFEFTIPGSSAIAFQIVVPVETILFGLEILLDIGIIKWETLAGDGTPSGAFSTALTAIPQNNVPSRPTPYYVAQNTVSTGGAVAGGTVIDLVRLRTDANTNRAASVGNVGGDERGVAPGTYYFRVTNLESTPTAVGVMKLRWEERP